MISTKVFLPFVFLISLTSCEKETLAVKREWLGRSSLASTFVGSPDPRQKDPPHGQRLFIRWKVPAKMLEEEPTLVLKILFRSLSEERVCYPLDKRGGYAIYDLLGEQYRETKGLLSYRVEVVSKKGEVLKEWQHLLWAQLITVDDEEEFLSDQSDYPVEQAKDSSGDSLQ